VSLFISAGTRPSSNRRIASTSAALTYRLYPKFWATGRSSESQVVPLLSVSFPRWNCHLNEKEKEKNRFCQWYDVQCIKRVQSQSRSESRCPDSPLHANIGVPGFGPSQHFSSMVFTPILVRKKRNMFCLLIIPRFMHDEVAQ
jgi:hypothetical protein